MASIVAVTVPRWGMTMSEGTICDWMVSEGDLVSKGQELIEIETTKITNVVEAPVAGTLRRIVLTKGITAPVGALAGVIAEPSTADADIDAFVESYADKMGDGTAEGEIEVLPKQVEIAGHRLNFLDAGEPTDDVFVLLHGFGGDLTTWLFNQPALAAERRTIAIDLPAHGGSDPFVSDLLFEEIVDVLDRLIGELDLKAIHLVGHSFGGGVAAELAARHPSTTRSLALLAPIGLGPDIDQAFLDDFVAAERRRPLQQILERLFDDPSKITSDMVEGVLRSKRLEGVSPALAAIARTIGQEGRQLRSIGELVSGMSCPVLAVWGETDGIVPPPLVGSLPSNVRLILAPGVGHMPQMEAAAAVNAALLENAGL